MKRSWKNIAPLFIGWALFCYLGSSSYKTPQKKASYSPLLYVILGFLLVKPLQDKGEQIETAHESEASSIDDIESSPPLPSHPDEKEVWGKYPNLMVMELNVKIVQQIPNKSWKESSKFTKSCGIINLKNRSTSQCQSLNARKDRKKIGKSSRWGVVIVWQKSELLQGKAKISLRVVCSTSSLSYRTKATATKKKGGECFTVNTHYTKIQFDITTKLNVLNMPQNYWRSCQIFWVPTLSHKVFIQSDLLWNIFMCSLCKSQKHMPWFLYFFDYFVLRVHLPLKVQYKS